MRPGRAWPLLRTAASRRALLAGLLPAVAGELAGAALLGVSGWFLTTCAVVTLQANTTWSWMYPSGAVRALALGRTGLRYLERLVNHRVLLSAQVALRARLARGAARLTPRELRAQGDGALLTRLTTDVETVAGLPGAVCAPLVAAVTTAGVVEILLLWAMPVLGAAELVVWAAGVGCARRAHRRARARLADAAEARAALRTVLLGSRAAFSELRCLDAVPQARRTVTEAVAAVEDAEWAAARAERLGRLALRLLAALGQASVLLIALTTTPAQPVAVVVGEVLLLAAGWDLLERLPRLLQHLTRADDAAARLAPLARESEIPEIPDEPEKGEGESADRSVASVAARGEASDRSPDRPVRGLEAVGLPLPGSCGTLTTTLSGPGLLLVTGANGSGKSTLLGRLAGRLPAAAGAVLLDGTPVHEAPARTVAETVTLVEADDWLADDTVAANLRQAAPSAGTDALQAVLDVVGLSALPLDASVGPVGRRLSQGQRRRLAIARAVLRRPPVLLLDEPVAGLDRPTAEALLAALPRVLPDTFLVIALQDQDVGLLDTPDAAPTAVVRLGQVLEPR
ncbi:ATP-binding cassette domain-containing protein [Streptomyces cinerochromogenes]|uniref:ATP-binding cassette domain-containing protein n=1 Tax=Streptomyces cinerochromogenes TaxID=66422 RepID=UPI00166FD0D1|nr:ATP-binding cassette domain-containing protein [Streptomyces cinerochromogenes]GGS53876.1 thiol reductant ABC exporter subunit CydC [Streptomyces cinerochromogenes]